MLGWIVFRGFRHEQKGPSALKEKNAADRIGSIQFFPLLQKRAHHHNNKNLPHSAFFSNLFLYVFIHHIGSSPSGERCSLASLFVMYACELLCSLVNRLRGKVRDSLLLPPLYALSRAVVPAIKAALLSFSLSCCHHIRVVFFFFFL